MISGHTQSLFLDQVATQEPIVPSAPSRYTSTVATKWRVATINHCRRSCMLKSKLVASIAFATLVAFCIPLVMAFVVIPGADSRAEMSLGLNELVLHSTDGAKILLSYPSANPTTETPILPATLWQSKPGDSALTLTKIVLASLEGGNEVQIFGTSSEDSPIVTINSLADVRGPIVIDPASPSCSEVSGLKISSAQFSNAKISKVVLNRPYGQFLILGGQ